MAGVGMLDLAKATPASASAANPTMPAISTYSGRLPGFTKGVKPTPTTRTPRSLEAPNYVAGVAG